MRVLTIIDSLDASGGAERSLAAVAPHLGAYGVELHVGYLCRRPRSVEPELRAGGATVHSLVGGGGRAGNTARVARVTKRLQPDLVHTTLFEADQAGRMGARIGGRPVVTSLVNVAYGGDQSASPGVRDWRLRAAQAVDAMTARLAVRFHAITAHVAEVMASRLHVALERIDVVPRGRDAVVLGERTRSRREQVRQALGLVDEQPFVLAVGRQEWQKGHDVLVAAVPQLVSRWPDLVVALAGREGAQSGRLHEAITHARVTDHVRLLGFREDVADLLCAADVFAFPSRWEGLGGTVLEAMALEAPTVASELPAVREVVTADSALLVAPGDPSALARAIDNCLADRSAARRRAEVARRRFLEEFTIERSAAGMVSFYERALRSTRR
jgi:glycosyltransferase involved in cell wall biosynthesis